ncbi:MAG: hypothetical protein WCL51_03285 [Bacteroidota bacterium]
MKIYIRKTITKDNIKDIVITEEDSEKDDIKIKTDVIIIDLVNRLTTKEEIQLSNALKKEDMVIVKDKNGKVEYFD